MKIHMLMAASLVVTAQIHAATTINPDHKYAYSGNAGWINARGDDANGAVIGLSYCTGYLYSANCGWISLGNGPTNGWQYSNASATDWGVNQDGLSNLFGRAYGANIGWVTFEQSYGFPKIDLQTGQFSGYAYGANIGWISLSNAQAFVKTDRMDTGLDSDNDTIPDAWEYQRVGNLTTLSNNLHDADGDGAPDVAEYPADTDPLADTSFLELAGVSMSSGTNRLTWGTSFTRFYRLDSTTNLLTTPFADSGLGLLVPDDITMARELPSPAGASVYYRVNAVVPLSE